MREKIISDWQSDTLDSSTFPELQEYEGLIIQHNSKLETLTLKDLPELQRLQIYTNALKSITLKNLPCLQLLDIQENTLINLDLPEELPNLSFFEIDAKDVLSYFQLPILPYLLELKIWNLSGNRIFEDLPNLQTLDISGNEGLVSIDCSGIAQVPTFSEFKYDDILTITCDETLFDTISSPALLKIKKKIKPKES